MKRLTHERSNGIKSGYWSPNKKDELVQRLAAYENTGVEPEEIKSLVDNVIYVNKQLMREWLPADEPPETDDYILLSFENYSIPLVGRYEKDGKGGAYYVGDDMESCISADLYVNAWMPLPKPYREE